MNSTFLAFQEKTLRLFQGLFQGLVGWMSSWLIVGNRCHCPWKENAMLRALSWKKGSKTGTRYTTCSVLGSQLSLIVRTIAKWGGGLVKSATLALWLPPDWFLDHSRNFLISQLWKLWEAQISFCYSFGENWVMLRPKLFKLRLRKTLVDFSVMQRWIIAHLFLCITKTTPNEARK